MTDTTTNAEDWFYTYGGERKGPVPTEKLRELLNDQTIDADTPIWRKGQMDWKPLRDTELGTHLKDTPPPIGTSHIDNGLVWTLALAPLAYAFLQDGINTYQNANPYADHSLSTALFWLVPACINATLCLFDERNLKRAGYASGWMTFFAVLLAPGYLFMRAQHLRQRPTYGYVWIASFIVSIILT